MNNPATHSGAQPLRGRNALEAAVFAVELRMPPSPQAIPAIREALRQYENELPGEQVSQPNGFVIAMGAGVPPFGEAFRFFAKPNGEHSWRVQLTANVLQVACFDYTRFDLVWPQAMRYLYAMLAAADADSVVTSISHQYVDKFVYRDGMPLEEYIMEELFSRDSPYLTDNSWKNGPLWHVYQGWFSDVEPNSRVLHQLNITNTELGPHKIGSIVDHRCVQQAAHGYQMTANAMAAMQNSEAGSLDATMRKLHTLNKEVLKQLLQTKKLHEIGMET